MAKHTSEFLFGHFTTWCIKVLSWNKNHFLSFLKGSHLPKIVKGTAQKVKFSMKDFFSKCDQIRGFLWIWSHLFTEEILNGKLHFLCRETRLVFSRVFYIRGNLGNVRFIFPPVHWLKKSDYSSLSET